MAVNAPSTKIPTSRDLSGYPSYNAVAQPSNTSYAGSTWSGPNAPRTSFTTTPNMLPQEHEFAIAEQNNAAAIANDQMRIKAQLAADAEARRLKAVQGLMPGAGQGFAIGEPPPGPTGPSKEEAARAAAFGRAKEQAGQTAAASLKALEDVMAARGLRGSTIEGNATADVLTGGLHELNDLVRSQSISDNNRAGTIADRDYQGNIVKRGQDMDYIRSLLSVIGSGGGIY